ncbi:hypothetical protein [Spirosoma rhododendri]|uniref:Uncharacterized protein n=1 Tax=Spirosoma rhododendri TaxID=2728024 RepID=A0A7L5DPK7_9BACT|nr:hypothetical protein [Spirosoma rhododendri]QJD79522.1 hypothetical protein HH216_14720 [Spirosoma rhododendri]
MITAQQLCYCDVLLTPGEAAKESDEKRGYIVSSIIQMPKRINDGYREYVEWQIAGFYLLESKTLTRREVTLEEMELSLAEGSLVPYLPPTVRQVKMG